VYQLTGKEAIKNLRDS